MKHLLSFLKSFKKDTQGSMAVEAVIIIPVLVWALAAMAIFFDVMRTKSTTEKAAFTISDMLSRETNSINATYITNTRELFDSLAKSDEESSLRVSVMTWNEDESEYELEWSEARGANLVALVTSDLVNIAENLPAMADQDTVILVETQTSYEPVLQIGLGTQTISTFVFTRPRYAPQLAFAS